jgi:hypothetical protein
MQPTLPLGDVKLTDSVIASGSVDSEADGPVVNGALDELSAHVAAADDDVVGAGR